MNEGLTEKVIGFAPEGRPVAIIGHGPTIARRCAEHGIEGLDPAVAFQDVALIIMPGATDQEATDLKLGLAKVVAEVLRPPVLPSR